MSQHDNCPNAASTVSSDIQLYVKLLKPLIDMSTQGSILYTKLYIYTRLRLKLFCGFTSIVT